MEGGKWPGRFAILKHLSSILAARRWLAEPKLGRAKAGARGRGCTCTGDALDVVPLLVGLHERKADYD